MSVQDEAPNLLPRDSLYFPPAPATNVSSHLMTIVRCRCFGCHKNRFKPAITVTALAQALPKHNRGISIINGSIT